MSKEQNIIKAKNNIIDVALKISNIIQDEKIDQDAKNELELVSTELYYFGAKKDKDNISQKNEKKEIIDICDSAASDIDRIIQKYQIEDRESEILEDVSIELLSIKNSMGMEQKTLSVKTMTLDRFFDKVK